MPSYFGSNAQRSPPGTAVPIVAYIGSTTGKGRRATAPLGARSPASRRAVRPLPRALLDATPNRVVVGPAAPPSDALGAAARTGKRGAPGCPGVDVLRKKGAPRHDRGAPRRLTLRTPDA